MADRAVDDWFYRPMVGDPNSIDAGLHGRQIGSVTLLGSNFSWKQERDALVISCPDEMPFKSAIGFKIL